MPQVYLVWGPPGTGKTTYITQHVDAWAEWATARGISLDRILLCSLTRTAAEELRGRRMAIPSECVGTLHSHGYRMLGTHLPVAEEHISDFTAKFPQFRVSAARISQYDNDYDAPPCDDDDLAQYDLLRHTCMPKHTWPIHITAFAKAWESWKSEVGMIDYTDMIEIPLREKLPHPARPMLICADEAQDFSALEYRFLQHLKSDQTRLIIVGDPWQCLYQWRGASPDLFLDPTVPDSRRKVLSQSYRIPRAVHARAMQWIRNLSTYTPIEYYPTDREGAVMHCGATYITPQKAIHHAVRYMEQGNTVMITATCGYMLAPAIAYMRAQGIPFANPWRRPPKGAAWNPLWRGRGVRIADRMLDYLTPATTTTAAAARTWTYAEIARWASVLSSKGVLRHGAKKIIAEYSKYTTEAPMSFLQQIFTEHALDEVVEIFLRYESHNATLADVLAWWMSKLQAQSRKAAEYPRAVMLRYGAGALVNEPRIYIGTIHSFKGAEADVVIIFPDLSFRGAAAWERGGVWRDAIVRQFYVGLTRAKECIYICEPVDVRLAVHRL